MPDTQEDLLEVAHEAARAAAAELASRFGRAPDGVRMKSGPTDPVSEADLAAERAIRSVLSARRPNDTVIGEEEGAVHGSSELRWVVDPLDGTVNFLFGIPLFAVSVACEDDDGVVAGVVLDPVRDECFAATRSSAGATLNGVPIRASTAHQLSTAMVATGFTYDAATRESQAALAARVIPAVRDIRRCGAAALDLCWTACGRFDAFYERGLNGWDIAAGTVVCARAGLDVRVLPATGHEKQGVIAAPAGLMDALWDLVVD